MIDTSDARFSTALRKDARTRIEQLGYADIVIGIPTYFSSSTIAHVIETAAEGLDKYYNDKKALIVVSEGGSTDDSREVAFSVDTPNYNIEKIVTIYRGVPGKGSALRAVFEIADFLQAEAVAVLDSDLKSITPKWIKHILDPIFKGFDYVTPDYRRYRFDATITNNVAYDLTRSVYGYRIRQPIGGDFGMSRQLIKHFLDEDVWGTNVARFGIDIWMTTTAIVDGFKICQTRLGSKVHGEKKPATDLSAMFRDVVGTLFMLMEEHEDYWKGVTKSREVPIFGEYEGLEPAPFEIDQGILIDYFKLGFNNFSSVWRNIIEKKDFRVLQKLDKVKDKTDFIFPIAPWVRIIYRYSYAFHSTPRQRFKLLGTVIPIYNARVASLVNELRDSDSEGVERYFEKQAEHFESMKGYLFNIWKQGDDAAKHQGKGIE